MHYNELLLTVLQVLGTCEDVSLALHDASMDYSQAVHKHARTQGEKANCHLSFARGRSTGCRKPIPTFN